jgi:hypothetical protein
VQGNLLSIGREHIYRIDAVLDGVENVKLNLCVWESLVKHVDELVEVALLVILDRSNEQPEMDTVPACAHPESGHGRLAAQR